jgi:multiple sugar transport system substrate-binding protein
MPEIDNIGSVSRRRFLQWTGSAGAVGAASLAGCSRLTGNDDSDSKRTITVAVFGAAAYAKSRQQISSTFEEAHKGVRVDLMPIQGTDWNDFFTKVLTQVASDQAPDVVEVATEGTQLFANKLAARLDSYVQRDAGSLREYFGDVAPALVEASMVGGGLYAMPSKFNTALIHYNKKLFSAAGLQAPRADWTYEDLRNAGKALAQTRDNKITPYAWANSDFGGIGPWLFAHGSDLFAGKKAPGGEWLWSRFYGSTAAKGRGGGWSWTEPTANTAANVEVLEYVRSLVSDGVTPAPTQAASSSLIGLFASGKIGMAPGGGSWAGGVQQSGMDKSAFDVQYFPRWTAQRQQFGCAGYMLMNKAHDKDLAWEFIKHAVSAESMRSAYQGNTETPARRSLMVESKYATTGPANWRAYYDSIDKLPSGPLPAPQQVDKVTAAYVKYVSLGTNGSLTPKKALDSLQSELESIVH